MSEELKKRAVCKTCRNIESMDHVLFRCDMPEQQLIWKLLKDLWAYRPPMASAWLELPWSWMCGLQDRQRITKNEIRSLVDDPMLQIDSPHLEASL